MNIYEVMFILQFALVIAILLTKLYNVMTAGELYDIKGSIILLILFFLLYGVGMMIFIINYNVKIYQMIFTLESWLVLLNVVFFIVELFYHLRDTTQNIIQPYNSIKANGISIRR